MTFETRQKQFRKEFREKNAKRDVETKIAKINLDADLRRIQDERWDTEIDLREEMVETQKRQNEILEGILDILTRATEVKIC